MGFSLPWSHGYSPSSTSVEGTSLAYDTTYVERARERLLYQFHGRPRMEALVGCLVAPFQEIELVTWQLLAERTLDTALAHALRALVHLVGIRGYDSSPDSLLRRFARAVILARRSDGNGNDLIKVARAFMRSSAIELRAYYPATITVRLAVEIESAEARLLGLLLRVATSAGVRLFFEYIPHPELEAFTLAESLTDDELSDTRGLGDDDDTIGGRLLGATTGEE